MIIPFSQEYRPRIEVMRVRDRSSSHSFYIFELVGRDKDGPFRIDVSHRHTLDEVADEVATWRRDGIEVNGSDEMVSAILRSVRGCQ